MDLGATLCTRSKPRCDDCPMKTDCIAFADNRQTELPAKKPKKIIPEKNIVMLIAKDKAGDVFMQKRPPTGIWGGLWCFPQFDNEEEANNFLSMRDIKCLWLAGKANNLGLCKYSVISL